jgi:hypothetical protein
VQDVADQCQFLKSDGERCKGRAYNGPFCTFHDPARAQEQRRARQAGGRKRSRPAAVLADLPDDTPLATLGDVTAFLAVVARKTMRGELDARVANSVTQTLFVLLRALEPGEVEELKSRVQRVEGQADVFSRVAEFSEALRQLRDAERNGAAAPGKPGGGEPGVAGDGERGLQAGALPGVGLRELLAASAADRPAGGVPVPDLP